jgi:lipopolysaccharide/colanic/teichoic acid biosynthesis glycosyltransferase
MSRIARARERSTVSAATGRHRAHSETPLATAARLALPPLTAAVVFALLSGEGVLPGALALIAFAIPVGLANRHAPWENLLPTLPWARLVAVTVTGLVLLAGLLAIHTPSRLPISDLLAAAAASGVAGLLTFAALGLCSSDRGRVRTAVIGPPLIADGLVVELELANVSRYDVIGRIAIDDTPAVDGTLAPGTDRVPLLGQLTELGALVVQHDIDLLILSNGTPRLRVFEEVTRSCLHLPVRLWELSGLYEETFGHVPGAEINASWFQYIIHPHYRCRSSASKRILDFVLATAMVVATAPLLLILMLLVRRDGGPSLFMQRRVGEGGRPITIYKLRTMRVGSPETWAIADDDRVTRIGRVLRRTHFDELPQLLNVIRGDMSLVGPRPEQPQIVDRLEQLLPYYERRHLIKPGLTGWAQVRCGYAGSELGTAWKLCHDLYYLKHRSVAFDLAILAETISTCIVDHQYSLEPRTIRFILAQELIQLERAASAGADGRDRRFGVLTAP